MARIDHVNFTVSDLEKSIQWYQDIFEFKKVESGINQFGVRWAIVAHNDSMIAMSEHLRKKSAALNEDHSIHRIFHFGLRIENIDDWREKLARFELKLYYGGEIEYPHSRSWYIHDPSGHEIEVSYSGGEPLRFEESAEGRDGSGR